MALQEPSVQRTSSPRLRSAYPLRFCGPISEDWQVLYVWAGEMDMLLVTPDGDFLVIELKRRSTDTTVGQLCRYLGFVKTHLCSEGQIAYGLILAMEFSESMRYALAMVGAISARTISFQIKVDSVDAF